MKRSRSVDSTYFEMLDWYFKKQSATRISPIAQAVMSHILWQCNANYSDSFEMNEKFLAVLINIDVRTLRAKLQELNDKNYLTFEKTTQDCYKIVVSIPKKEAEVCTDYAKTQHFCTERQGVTPFFQTNKNKIKQRKVNLYEVDLSKD